MSCSRISKLMTRPSVILLGLVLLAMAGAISGSPVPDSAESIKDKLNSTADSAKGFFERVKNTFTGKVDKE